MDNPTKPIDSNIDHVRYITEQIIPSSTDHKYDSGREQPVSLSDKYHLAGKRDPTNVSSSRLP